MASVHYTCLMIIAPTSENISIAGRALREGSIVAIPTETVYGLAGRIDSEEALRTIFAVKGRPADNPLIVHVATVAQAHALILATERSIVDLLAAAFWPGPLTIVLRKAPGLSDQITAGLDTVAIRMPSHPIALEVIKAAGSPLAAPSANRSGRPSPTMAVHVENDLGNSIVILDGGPCEIGIESTVVRALADNLLILRPGVISAEALASATGMQVSDPTGAEPLRASPGTRYRHYSPNAAIQIALTVDAALEAVRVHGANTMVLAPPMYLGRFIGCFTGSLTEHDLYAELRRSDDLHVDRIVVLCDDSLARQPALLNRVRKAAGEGNEEDAGT
ncbi:MAG: L-threonylcarbamoyladenylate synthase [Candidatus Kapabacteria bacterium]|nr:L-threonylcarbamoyladenylate synthase [Candidatus Kapabacteria bacterium]